jgi:cytidylate kinase
MASAPVLAIDGPSGSGKGTVARRIAALLGWHLLDSGALYRLVAMQADRHDIEPDDEAGIARLATDLPACFDTLAGEERILLNGSDVTSIIRTEKVGEGASRVASFPAVRSALLLRQRTYAEAPGLVADGRDMGTVVFPDAVIKVFLTASPEARVLRRHKQLKEKGIDVSLRDLSRDIAERDRRDISRSLSPLRPAVDANMLDSTGMSPEEVVDRIIDWLVALGFKPAPKKNGAPTG